MGYPEIRVFTSTDELAEHLAVMIHHGVTAIQGEKYFSMALSGGSTPKLIFSYIADHHANDINWKRVKFFWVDERCVPPTNEQSNYLMTQISLLDKLNIPARNIFRIKGEMQPEMEAIRYSHTIVRQVGVINGLPRFDLVLLGLGDDGHTASIFPGHTDLFSSPNICEVATQPNSGQQRITITGGVINQAAEVLFMVTGKSKAGAVHAVIEKKDPMLPATFVYPLSGKLTWLLDHESSSRLKERLNG